MAWTYRGSKQREVGKEVMHVRGGGGKEKETKLEVEGWSENYVDWLGPMQECESCAWD